MLSINNIKYAVGLIAFSAVSMARADGIQTLEVSGDIRVFSDQGKQHYLITPEQFAALPRATITTATSWTPVSTFTGVRMEEIMRLTGAKGAHVRVFALDDYSVQIPVADFRRYGVILASSMNGKPLPRNAFGPYFLIYPKDKYPKELGTPTAEAKFVWQVHRLVFQ
jgi:hypothetical protein